MLVKKIRFNKSHRKYWTFEYLNKLSNCIANLRQIHVNRKTSSSSLRHTSINLLGHRFFSSRAFQFDFQKSSRPDCDGRYYAIDRWTREENKQRYKRDKIVGTSDRSTGPRRVLSRDVREDVGLRSLMWPLQQGPRSTNHRCTMPVWHFHYGGRGTIIIGLTSSFVRLKLPGNRPPSTSPKRLRRFFFQISRFTATWISRNAKRIHLVFQRSLAKTEANPLLPVGDESN